MLERIGPTLYERFGRLDILVANAGALGVLSPVQDIQPDDWAEAMAVNVTANWRLIRSTARLLLAAEAGRAVFVTSRIVLHPTAYWGTYGATKAALHHLIQSWAAETATTKPAPSEPSPSPGTPPAHVGRQAPGGKQAVGPGEALHRHDGSGEVVDEQSDGVTFELKLGRLFERLFLLLPPLVFCVFR